MRRESLLRGLPVEEEFGLPHRLDLVHRHRFLNTSTDKEAPTGGALGDIFG